MFILIEEGGNQMFTQTRRTSLVLVGIMVVSILISSMIVAAPVASARTRRDEPKKTIRIRFTDKDTNRLIAIGGIYFLSKAISEAGRTKEVVYVSPPPQYSYAASQPTYTPIASAAVTVTVRNSTGWYLVVNINGRQLNLYPGYEQSVSWIYTGQGQYVEAMAYLDPYHQQLAGTYQGNLVGYQIPWRLNFDYGSFTVR